MRQLVKSAKIISTGSYVPKHIVTNKDLEKKIDTNDEWIYQNLGIKERRVALPNQCTSDLAAKAAINAMNKHSIKSDEIDLIVVATATPDRLSPSTACIVQDKISAHNAVAFDISAVCSGFLFGMSVVTQFIANGIYKKALLIGADTFSRITNWESRDAVFFGDGAGAAIFSPANNTDGFQAFRLYSDGSGKFNFTVEAGGSEYPASLKTIRNAQHYFKMNGKAVYETGIDVLPKAINQVLKDTKLSIDAIDYLIPHQPSIRILIETAKRIGLPWKKVMTNMQNYANTSGGTIPILLDEVCSSGKLKKNDKILFAAVGSGWTYGASILNWS